MNTGLVTRTLSPFGLEVTVDQGSSWHDIDAERVHTWVAAHRVVVFRGLSRIPKIALPGAARRLGPLQAWAFGAVNELHPREDATNYLYTRGAVPLHWDGAFTARVPRYLFFQCVRAPNPDAGGRTVFVDTTRVWSDADEATRDRWRALSFVYGTDRLVHYGGRFTSPVVAEHPYTHEVVLRFAEPVDARNPVSVRAADLSPLESAAMVTSLRAAMDTPSNTYRHTWRDGDIVVADNHALLHGREPFTTETARQLERVNVHGPERTRWDAVRDAIRIRRPEFMVAELPILLIPALLVTARGASFATPTFALLAALFFLLFHFGDMINCLADRDLDAVYKTHLSEAVYGLGVRNVKAQIVVTAALALGLASALVVTTGRFEILALTVFGLGLASQYSLPPLWLKNRGLLQIAGLWAVIFIGPMLLVTRTLSAVVDPRLFMLFAAYGAMQQGIVLVNTAEDLPEDEASGIHTSARALGLRGSLLVSIALVGLGGFGVAGVLFGFITTSGRSYVPLVPLLVAVVYVLAELVLAFRAVVRAADAPIEALRPRARRMPLWITLTAFGTLVAAFAARADWMVR